MNLKTLAGAAFVAGLLVASANSAAVTVPFTETFEGGAANWITGANGAVTVVASGGADGGQFIRNTLNLVTTGSPLLFRCNGALDCSGDAFVGDWGDVDFLSIAVRHNAPGTINFFARMAPVFSAGLVFESNVEVAANTWTNLVFPISPSNPLLTIEGELSDYAGYIANIGNLQIGYNPPGIESTGVSFDLDVVAVSAVPLPAAAWLMLSAVGGLLGFARRT